MAGWSGQPFSFAHKKTASQRLSGFVFQADHVAGAKD
jgi:hypothetical protein